MQDRIDELQAELRDFHSLGRVQQPIGQPLSEELESKSPGMESDPGKTSPRRSHYRPSISYCDSLLPELFLQVLDRRKFSRSA